MPSEKAPPPGNLPGVPKEDEKKEKKEGFSLFKNDKKKEPIAENSPEDDTPPETEKDEKKELEKNRARDFLIVAGVFVVIAGLYLFNVFLTSYEKSEEISEGPSEEVLTKNPEFSFYRGWISLDAQTAGDAIYPGREYITISINRENLSYLYISDWSLVNSQGERFSLGEASYVPLRGKVNDKNDIIVNAGDLVVVNSGASPIGVSFRENICSGYFEQFQNFSPPIKRSCPDFEDRVEEIGDVCEAYVEAIPECESVVDPLPAYLSGQCARFIQTEITYNSCVETFRDSPGFKGNIWRIYLDEETQIWPEDGTITLLDSKGRVVDQEEY